MNNTDKLLRAFIEASGYEIEETSSIKRMYKRDDVMDNGELKENAMPESIIKTTDYKLTKKPYDPTVFPFDTDDGKIKHSLGGFGPVSIRIL